MLGSCSSSDDLNGGGNNTGFNETGKGYINISLNLPTQGKNVVSRAANDITADGDAKEYNVQDAALLLFAGTNENDAVFQGAYNLDGLKKTDIDANVQISTQLTKVQEISSVSATGNIYAFVLVNKGSNIVVGTDHSITVNGSAFNGKFSAFSQLKVNDAFAKDNLMMTNVPVVTKPGSAVFDDATVLADVTTSIFKTEAEAIAFPPKLFPSEWRFQNFADAWNPQPFGRYFLNSVLVTVGTTIGQVLSCSLVAYGFARFNFKGKNVSFMILLSTMMIPWDVTMIPQYMEFNMFGWINTLKPLIVPAWFGSAYYIFLMRQFLMGIPKDFEEAARIDGANSFQIYWKIFMPILRPSLILVGVLNMITAWNDYLGPLIFLQDRSKYTLALGLAQFKGVHTMQIIPMLCITIIMIVPPIIIFIIAQKYIVEGTSGSIK